MGSCFSKRTEPKHSATPTEIRQKISLNCSSNAGIGNPIRKEENHQRNGESTMKRKEVFVIKHRKSHDSIQSLPHSSSLSRTIDDVDAVPMERGWLRRSHSAGKLGAGVADEEREKIRSFASQERSRTHSQEIQSTASSWRRLSRSPGRRMDTNLLKPLRMMTVLASDKTSSSGNSAGASSTVTRISVKRNAGEGSPRSVSPSMNGKVFFSRKTSPCRRAPLLEIDATINQVRKLKETAEEKGGYEREQRGRVVNKSYTNLLLEDIENFHQKSAAQFTTPACLTNARSIIEAVADMNSSTKCEAKKRNEERDLFVESEVEVLDDLMQPSFQKYVTCRRRCARDDEESSGSNSVGGGGSANSVHRRIQIPKNPEKFADVKDDRITLIKVAKVQCRYMEADATVTLAK